MNSFVLTDPRDFAIELRPDEHRGHRFVELVFGHHRIIDFCERPFASTAEVIATLTRTSRLTSPTMMTFG
jgi:hypothetical protein